MGWVFKISNISKLTTTKNTFEEEKYVKLGFREYLAVEREMDGMDELFDIENVEDSGEVIIQGNRGVMKYK